MSYKGEDYCVSRRRNDNYNSYFVTLYHKGSVDTFYVFLFVLFSFSSILQKFYIDSEFPFVPPKILPMLKFISKV